MNLKKYLLVIKNSAQRQLAFRTNIMAFAVGNIFGLLVQIVVWTAVFKTTVLIKGYTYNEMITYVVIGWFFSFITSNYSIEENVAKDIHLGTLSNFITKPISYLKYMTAFAIGRVFIAFFVILFSMTLLVIVFYDKMIFDFDILKLIAILLMLILSYFIKLFLGVLI
jgi:ABC-type uncharacterized transport system permease subunit